MNDFDKITDKLKVILEIKSDSKLAEELGFSRANYAERKKKNSIPHEQILKICKKKNISLDYLYENDNETDDFNEKLNKSIKKLNEKESKYFYFLIETKLAEKELNN